MLRRLWSCVFVPLALVAFLSIQRMRRQPPGPDAVTIFEQRVAQPGADLADALAEYLASRLDCPAPSVIAPDLAARLRSAGAPAELAARTAALMERLVNARYGGDPAEKNALAETRTLIGALTVSPLLARNRG